MNVDPCNINALKVNNTNLNKNIKNSNENRKLFINNYIYGKYYNNENIENKKNYLFFDNKILNNTLKNLFIADKHIINKLDFELIKSNANDIDPFINSDKINEIINKKFGILNIGNNCYINLALQLLLHCEIFILKFLERMNKLKLNYNSISYNFFNICKYIIINNDNINLDISSFIYLFSINHPNIHVYSQNDSQEFLRIFLNDINLELNECNGLINYEEIIYNLSGTKLEMYNK